MHFSPGIAFTGSSQLTDRNELLKTTNLHANFGSQMPVNIGSGNAFLLKIPPVCTRLQTRESEERFGRSFTSKTILSFQF